jgi:hypothetical protein
MSKKGLKQISYENIYSKNIYFTRDKFIPKDVTYKFRVFDNNTRFTFNSSVGILYVNKFKDCNNSNTCIQNKISERVGIDRLMDHETIKLNSLEPAYFIFYQRKVFENKFSRLTIDKHNYIGRVTHKHNRIYFLDHKKLNQNKIEYKYLKDKKDEQIFNFIQKISNDCRTNLEVIKQIYEI